MHVLPRTVAKEQAGITTATRKKCQHDIASEWNMLLAVVTHFAEMLPLETNGVLSMVTTGVATKATLTCWSSSKLVFFLFFVCECEGSLL